MKNILILLCVAFYQFGNAQLIDPFGKVVTHEIKLTKLDDGAYMGAMEWTSGGIDSLQRFVVKNLDVKSPVMVRIISKAPDHNIDLSFHKKRWDKVESKISTNGDKFVDKIFRTMGMAGIGVSSKVEGIPYLIIVRVGLQFPSTKSLIRITDDIEEYNRHLRKLGIAVSLPVTNEVTNNSTASLLDNKGDNTFVYIIIGLLTLIIVLLVIFLIRKQKSKTIFVLWFAMCLSAYTMAQSNAPKSVPIGNPNGDAVFVEYRTSNVANQNSVPVTTVMNVGFEDIDVAVGTDMERRELRLDTAPGVRELTGEEAQEVLRRIKEANEAFDSEYRENMPGEPTDGNQRVPHVDQTSEELQQLRSQVRQLQRDVALLSEQHDGGYDEENQNNEAEIVILCDDIAACTQCLRQWRSKLQVKDAYFQYLQNFYASEIEDINNKIAWGNAGSNVHGVSAIVWQRILHTNIMPAVKTLKIAYYNKFDEYIESMRKTLVSMETCHTSQNPDGRQSKAIKDQAKALVEYYSRTKIID